MNTLTLIAKMIIFLFMTGIILFSGYLIGQRDKANRIFTPLYDQAFKKGFDSAMNKRIEIRVDSIIYRFKITGNGK